MEKRGDGKETPTEINARMLAELKAELANYKQQMDGALSQLFQNQEAMKSGLDSAEVNLRAFQKVINGQADSTLLRCEDNKVNWVEYYKLVDAEMKAIEESARVVEEQKTKARIKILVTDGKLEWLQDKISHQILAEKADANVIAEHMENATRFFEAARVHLERAQKGEIYDTNRLDQLLQMITVAERRDAGAEHQDEVPAEALGHLVDPDGTVLRTDEDEAVFGGDVPAPEETHGG